MPSTYPEAWGRVAGEAQASGIPVIASAVGGLPEAVGDGGLLVDPSAGVDAWLEAFALLWDDDDAYAGHASRAERTAAGRTPPRPRPADRFETLLRRSIGRLSAEREGFEPSMEVSPHTRLAGECLQPLGHLSRGGRC